MENVLNVRLVTTLTKMKKYVSRLIPYAKAITVRLASVPIVIKVSR